MTFTQHIPLCSDKYYAHLTAFLSTDQVDSFKHPMQDGWGLTSGKDHIIGSDGTANIYFMDPSTFKGKTLELAILEVRSFNASVAFFMLNILVLDVQRLGR